MPRSANRYCQRSILLTDTNTGLPTPLSLSIIDSSITHITFNEQRLAGIKVGCFPLYASTNFIQWISASRSRQGVTTNTTTTTTLAGPVAWRFTIPCIPTTLRIAIPGSPGRSGSLFAWLKKRLNVWLVDFMCWNAVVAPYRLHLLGACGRPIKFSVRCGWRTVELVYVCYGVSL